MANCPVGETLRTPEKSGNHGHEVGKVNLRQEEKFHSFLRIFSVVKERREGSPFLILEHFCSQVLQGSLFSYLRSSSKMSHGGFSERKDS